MKFSDDLLKTVSAILEAKPRVSFDGDKATVHSKNGTPMKSFNKKDLGNSFRKHADNFLSQNYKKLNAESVIVEELEEAKQLELPGMEQKKPKQLELPFGKKDDKKKPVKESEDQLDEISKSTMGSYVKKASDDVANRAYHSGGDRHDNEFNSSEKTPERKKLLNRQKGIKIAVKKLTKESEDLNTDNAAKATMHDCAKHVRHEEYGLGQCISTMHTLEEDEDGNGYVTHYDVMFQGEDGPFIKEDVWVEDLEIISEKHHGHPKGKKKMSEDIEAIEEKKHKKDKGDMDGDGVDEPDDKEYMDNKDKAIKAAMSKKKSESPIKKVEEAKKHVDEKKSSDCGEGEYFCKDAQKCKPIPEGMKLDGEQLVKEENIEEEFISEDAYEIADLILEYFPKEKIGQTKNYHIKSVDPESGAYSLKHKKTGEKSIITVRDNQPFSRTRHVNRQLQKKYGKKDGDTHIGGADRHALARHINKHIQHTGMEGSDPKKDKAGTGDVRRALKKDGMKRTDLDRDNINEAPTYVPGFMGADGKPTSKPTKKDYDSNKEYQHMKKKLGDRIPGPPPVKKINKEHLDSISAALQEISKKNLHKYVNSARNDRDERTADAHWKYHHSDGNIGDTADRFGGMDYANAGRKRDKRGEGITRAANRMADSKYGKAKPGQKTKLSKPLRVEGTEIQEISKATLNDYQDRRRHDKDVMNSRAAEKHQRAMDHGQGNYYSGTEKGKEKAAAIKNIKSDAADYGEKVNANKKFKKIVIQRGKENYYNHQQHKMGKNIDRAFNRLASDSYGKAKPGQKTKLASDVKKVKTEPASSSMYNKPKMIQPKFEKRKINKEHIESISAALQEISKKTLGSYAKKAVDDRDYRIGVEAGDKHSDKPVDLYHYKDDRKGSDFKVKRDNTDPKLTRRTKGIKLAVKKMQREDVETVSEISKTLAGNYLKKSMKSSDKQHSKMIAHGLNSSIANSMASGDGAPNKQEKKAAFKYADKEEDKFDKASNKYGKRQDGIKRAINTLAKESNQYTDDLADRIRSHENKTERKKAEKAFTAGDYEKATGHIGGTYREK